MRTKHTSGFTLIELLLYISCAAVMLTTVAVFLSLLLRARVHSQVIAEVDGQGQQVIALVSQLIRNGTQITAPGQGGSSASLSFTVPDAAKSPTVVSVVNGAFMLAEGNSAPVALTNSRVTASGVTFRNLSAAQTPGTVRLQFTLTTINPSGRNELNFTKDFMGSAAIP